MRPIGQRLIDMTDFDLYALIKDAISEGLKPLDEIQRAIDRPLTIKQCCERLSCSRTWFDSNRHILTPAGGTPKSPTYHRIDIDKLREKIKSLTK